MYCKKCRIIFDNFDNEICPACGAETVKQPTSDDPVFLTEKDSVWSDVVEGVLRNNAITYIKKGNLGAGFTIITGPLSETFNFYVPYEQYHAAKELIDELFDA